MVMMMVQLSKRRELNTMGCQPYGAGQPPIISAIAQNQNILIINKIVSQNYVLRYSG